MFLSKMKLACCAAALVISVGALGWREFIPSAGGGDKPAVAAAPEDKPEKKAPTDLDRLQGTWKILYAQEGGRKDDDNMRMVFAQSALKLMKSDRVTDEFGFKLDPSAKPKTIDIDEKGKTMPGIYELDGDSLKICFREKGEGRPTKFESAERNVVLLVLKRDTPGAKEKAPAAAEDLKRENQRLMQELRRALELARAAEQEARAQRDAAEKSRAEAEEARRVAEAQRRAADDARRQAEAQRRKAEKNLEDAKKALDETRKELEKVKGPKKL